MIARARDVMLRAVPGAQERPQDHDRGAPRFCLCPPSRWHRARRAPAAGICGRGTISTTAITRSAVVPLDRSHIGTEAAVYGRIERLVDSPYQGLFARERRANRDVTGDQVDDHARYRRRQPSKIRDRKRVAPAVAQTYAAE